VFLERWVQGGGKVVVACHQWTSQGSSKPTAFPRRPNTMPCSFYLKTGACSYGMQCQFDHPKSKITDKVGLVSTDSIAGDEKKLKDTKQHERSANLYGVLMDMNEEEMAASERQK